MEEKMQEQVQTKILIAEDDNFLRKSISTLIRKKGYFPIEAENGHEALALFRNDHPSLILTDLRMPVMDGFDLLDEIMMESPETPVIIFSGVGDKPDIITAMRSGAWDYITKPIEDIDFLMERIEKALVQAQMTNGYSETMENALKKTNNALKKELAEKKKLEKMIIRAKREWERTVDCLDEMIALIDRNHSLIRVNKAMARAFGKVPPELISKTCYLSTQGFNNRQQAEEDSAALLTGKPVTGRFHDETSRRQYEINLTPYYDLDDRTIIGSVYIARDITNR